MKKAIIVYVFLLLLPVFLAGCGCGGGDNPVLPPVLVSLEVSPVNPSIALGTCQQFKATGVFSDNSTQDMTETVTWSLSDEAVASISNDAASKGLACSLSAGATKVIATSGSVSNFTSLTVTAATLVSIGVTPAASSVALGTSQQFKATGVFSDNSTQDMTEAVTWSLSDEAIAAISNDANSKGLARSRSVGTTTVKAASGNVFGTASLTVTAVTLASIEVTPNSASIALGTLQQFKATGIYSDNTTQDLTETATWSLSNEAVASISNVAKSKGLARSVALGTTAVRAASGGLVGTASLTVTAASPVSLSITPKNPTVVKGMTQQFKATGTFTDNSSQDLTSVVTWSSSDPSVATISNAAASKGLATAVAGGTTTIKATFGNLSDSTQMTVPAIDLVKINVTPYNPVARFGVTIQFKATGIYSDNSSSDITTVVTWSSSDTSIATISNASGTKGLATTDHKVGSTTITATLGTISGSSVLRDP